jgi:hypothetical protein
MDRIHVQGQDLFEIFKRPLDSRIKACMPFLFEGQGLKKRKIKKKGQRNEPETRAAVIRN